MEDSVRKFGILVVCLMLAIVILGCVGQKSETTTPTRSPQSTVTTRTINETHTPNASVPYDIEWGLEYREIHEPTYQRYVQLKIEIKAKEASDMYVIVSDPDGYTIGKKFIPKEDLFDGLEIVNFQMGDYERTPKEGKYTVVLVSSPSRELLYKETRTFNASLSVHTDILTYPSGKYLMMVWENTGDLPIFIQYATMEIKKEYPKKIVYLWEHKAPPAGSELAILLMPGGDFVKQIPLDNFNEGTYLVLIILHYPIGEKGFAGMDYNCKLHVYKNGSAELSQSSTRIYKD